MARPRRSANTRNRLLETGVALLIERGYHGTGIQRVLDEVGVPKGSFYNYFESKEDFGAQVIRHFAEQVNGELGVALEKADKNALAALRKFFGNLRRKYEANGFTGGCLVANMGAEVEDSDICRRALQDAMQGWRERFRMALALAQEQGTVRTDVPAGELADLLLNAWEGAVIRMKIERSAKPLRQCIKRLFDDYFRP